MRPGESDEDFNGEDEANILADQDETHLKNLQDNDKNIGSDGTDDYALDSADFAHGEIDVKEQMDRMTAQMDVTHHRPLDPDVEPRSPQGIVDATEARMDSLGHATHRENEKKDCAPRLHKGHGTGAYTDIGAGRSGITRTRH